MEPIHEDGVTVVRRRRSTSQKTARPKFTSCFMSRMRWSRGQHLCEVYRVATSLTKNKPPPASSHGHESQQRRETTTTPQDAASALLVVVADDVLVVRVGLLREVPARRFRVLRGVCGALTSSIRRASVSRGRGWSQLQFWASSDRVATRGHRLLPLDQIASVLRVKPQ